MKWSQFDLNSKSSSHLSTLTGNSLFKDERSTNTYSTTNVFLQVPKLICKHLPWLLNSTVCFQDLSGTGLLWQITEVTMRFHKAQYALSNVTDIYIISIFWCKQTTTNGSRALFHPYVDWCNGVRFDSLPQLFFHLSEGDLCFVFFCVFFLYFYRMITSVKTSLLWNYANVWYQNRQSGLFSIHFLTHVFNNTVQDKLNLLVLDYYVFNVPTYLKAIPWSRRRTCSAVKTLLAQWFCTTFRRQHVCSCNSQRAIT